MKRYTLLRKNRESGPYSLKELKDIGLAPTDLIWIEGESTAWIPATDLEELNPIVGGGIIIPLAAQFEENEYSHTNSPAFTAFVPTASEEATGGQLEDYSPFLADREKPIEWKPQRKRKAFAQFSVGLFSAGVFLVGIMMCVFVVKNVADHFNGDESLASSEAIEIKREVLPVSTSMNLARAADFATADVSAAETAEALPVAMTPLENSATTGADTKTKNTPIKTPAKFKAAKVQDSAVQTTGFEEESVALTDEKPVVEKPVKKEASLAIAANDYKVGMFGGISDLELALTNSSDVAIESATVEVEYLKPNGGVVKSHTVTVENLMAGGSKKLKVPESNRGVKIRYRVVSLRAVDKD